MVIVSWNVNGLRAAHRKGFLRWVDETQPDVICLQEIKAREEQLPEEVALIPEYHAIFNPAVRPGYSGTATYIKKHLPLGEHRKGFGIDRFTAEGRVLGTWIGDIMLYNIYFPNGQRDRDRLSYKLDFYDAFFDHIEEERRQGVPIIICGDFNTAHQEIDLARPKENVETSGFLAVERERLDRLSNMGFVDTFRHIHGPKTDRYSWWSMQTRARERNIGWRIDAFWASKDLLPRILSADIHDHVYGSDHCPVVLELQDAKVNA